MTPTATESVDSIESIFGKNSFCKKVMKERLTPVTFERIQSSILDMTPVRLEDADEVADALKVWATEMGATHFAHWFHPMTGGVAMKHDSFLDRSADGSVISSFSGSQLLKGEADGSSFPNGGLRQTHAARGYTVWDPAASPFILDHGNGKTLYIPAVFYSWTGEALDERLPLLRSNHAVTSSALQLLKAAGSTKHKQAYSYSGVEQEFFLVDRELYLRRPDLVEVGRTLVGRSTAKGQSMDDQYFGDLSERMLSVLADAERELWALGIPMVCRHREVAPGQYEVAPCFSTTPAACDQNALLMGVLQRVARRHGTAVLFHEKPFNGLNGSGKHNNWSVGTDAVPSLLAPGTHPASNVDFMLMLGAVLRGVHRHGDVLRVAVSGAGNDFRLGAQEAPPAIVSAHLGEDVERAVDEFIAMNYPANDGGDGGDGRSRMSDSTHSVQAQTEEESTLDEGYLPAVKRARSDRNRTSTVAFVDNRFEFRAVGSSQPVGRSATALNAIVAESMRDMAAEIEQLVAAGEARDAAARRVAAASLLHSRDVVFGGDGYSSEWVSEAGRRGLPHLVTTADALESMVSEKNITLFHGTGVLTKNELRARAEVMSEEYCGRVRNEARMLTSLCNTEVIPAAASYQALLADAAHSSVDNAGHATQLLTVSSCVNGLVESLQQLDLHQSKAEVPHDYAFKVLPLMRKVRAHADALESLLPAKDWPLPSYHEMLFHQD